MRDIKKVTIKDVAQEANVAIATVSRVLSNNYPVSKQTRKNVLDAVKKLNYRPNSIARSLKAQQTFLVGMVVADLSNPFFMKLTKDVEHYLWENGYNIIIAEHEENPKKEQQIVEMLLENKVAAIITTTCHPDKRYYKNLKDTGVPIVFVDRRIEGCEMDTIVEDNEANSRELVEHLLSLGHRRIVVVNGDLSVNTALDRYQGYVSAFARRGIEVDERYVINANLGPSYPIIKRVLQEYGREQWPTVIYGTNNLRAEAALRVCMDLQMRVPQDISVVSYGDIAMPWLYSLKLTHIDQDMVRIGKKAGEIVIRKVRQPSDTVTEYIIESRIVIGNSVRDLRQG